MWHTMTKWMTNILPQILGSLPEVIRSWCAHHHHHHHHHHKVFARPFGVERSLSRSQPPEPSGGRPWEAAFGQRHPSRPASRRYGSSAVLNNFCKKIRPLIHVEQNVTSFVLIDRTSNQNQQNLGKPAQL
jgi:hypothetical protein